MSRERGIVQTSDAWDSTLSSLRTGRIEMRPQPLRFIQLSIGYGSQAERIYLSANQKAERVEVSRESEPISAVNLDR